VSYARRQNPRYAECVRDTPNAAAVRRVGVSRDVEYRDALTGHVAAAIRRGEVVAYATRREVANGSIRDMTRSCRVCLHLNALFA
jgi:hypothetical protein